MEVKVEAVNMDERKIDSLISASAPRNVGKTAREKAKKAVTRAANVVRQKVNFEQTAPSAVRKAEAKSGEEKARKAKSRPRKRRKLLLRPKRSEKQQAEYPLLTLPTTLRIIMSEMIYGIHAVQALLERARKVHSERA